MLTYFRINYLTNLTYFPIFPHYVDFSKVAAASPLAAAGAAVADFYHFEELKVTLVAPKSREKGFSFHKFT